MKNNASFCSRSVRRGVTVIETLFAMGIALMGLAGIASLVLLAGRQASDSNRSSEAQAFAHDWYAEFNVRGLNNVNRWAWCDDSLSTPALVGFNKLLANTYSSKGSSTIFLRELGRESVCLDPKFFSSRDIGSLPNDSDWYRPSVFPYYADRYNPTIDPAYTAGTGSHQWGDQPRMLRVTTSNNTVTKSGTSIVANAAYSINRSFVSDDDLNIFRSDSDASIAPTRVNNGSAFSGEAKYSWLATISPTEPANANTTVTDLYTLSLVVMKDRDLLFMLPSSRNVNSPPLPDENPQGERNLLVVPQSGNFVGGNGGRVRLIGSEGVDSQVHVGDWVMLSKYYNISFVLSSNSFRPNSVFRWYRIIAVDSEEVVGPLPGTDPYGLKPPANHNIWWKDVVLDGPDWSFNSSIDVTTNTGVVTFPTPTTGTMVKGVVGVFERVVNISTDPLR